jgi:SAM-dependent methyltransferase
MELPDMDMNAFLVCPRCRGELEHLEASFRCRACGRTYPLVDEVPQFDQPEARDGSGVSEQTARDTRRAYWDQGWQARFQGDHSFLDGLKQRSDWAAYLEPEIAQLRAQGHVSCVEARGEIVNGKVVLDIGCGSGTTGATLAYQGARYIGLDHSPNAASRALRNLRSVGADGFTVQGNAEALPIRDNSIDVVYSNGVLHHTPNFSAAMDEAYRVLKPDGQAIIALYATYSLTFGLVRLAGLLRGNLTRSARTRWMGDASEGAWRTGGRLNPWTETFSAVELRRFVHKYNVRRLSFRRNGPPIRELPRIGPRLAALLPFRQLDRLLEPSLGSMLIMSFNK